MAERLIVSLRASISLPVRVSGCLLDRFTPMREAVLSTPRKLGLDTRQGKGFK